MTQLLISFTLNQRNEYNPPLSLSGYVTRVVKDGYSNDETLTLKVRPDEWNSERW